MTPFVQKKMFLLKALNFPPVNPKYNNIFFLDSNPLDSSYKTDDSKINDFLYPSWLHKNPNVSIIHYLSFKKCDTRIILSFLWRIWRWKGNKSAI